MGRRRYSPKTGSSQARRAPRCSVKGLPRPVTRSRVTLQRSPTRFSRLNVCAAFRSSANVEPASHSHHGLPRPHQHQRPPVVERRQQIEPQRRLQRRQLGLHGRSLQQHRQPERVDDRLQTAEDEHPFRAGRRQPISDRQQRSPRLAQRRHGLDDVARPAILRHPGPAPDERYQKRQQHPPHGCPPAPPAGCAIPAMSSMPTVHPRPKASRPKLAYRERL